MSEQNPGRTKRPSTALPVDSNDFTTLARRIPPKTAENEKIAARSAELSVQGVKLSEQLEILSKEFGVTIGQYRLENIRRKPIFKEILKKFRTEIVDESVARLKQEVSRLRPKIIKAIEAGLDNENMQAARLALEVIGFGEKKPEQEKGTGEISIILPGLPDSVQQSLRSEGVNLRHETPESAEAEPTHNDNVTTEYTYSHDREEFGSTSTSELEVITDDYAGPGDFNEH